MLNMKILSMKIFSLRNVMWLNATSCVLFGSVFALLPNEVAHFLSEEAPAPLLLIMVIGVILIVNGLHLFWVATEALPKKELILYFSSGDFIWVILSIVLLISGLWVTSSQGILVTILIAIMVGFFGVMQMVKRREMGHC